MNIFEKIRKSVSFLSKRKPEAGVFRDFFGEHHLAYRSSDKNLSNIYSYYHAYEANVVVKACVDVYIEESSLAGFSINSDENNTGSTDYLIDLFNHPLGTANQETFESLNRKIWLSYLLTGDAFVEVIYDGQIPTGFSFIPVEAIARDVERDCWKLRDSDHYFTDEEIIHIYDSRASICNEKWGISALDSVATDIALIYYANEYNKSVFENKGILPSGILNFSPDADSLLIQENVKRMRSNEAQKGLLVLQGAQYQSISRSGKDLEFVQMYENARNNIIAAFHLQPSKLGIADAGALGTGRGDSQQKAFARALEGKTRVIENAFNRILKLAGFSEEFSYNRLNILDESVKIEQNDVQIRNGSRTINEIRNQDGFAPVEWGDAPLGFNSFGVLSDGVVEPLASDGESVGQDIANPPRITEPPVTEQVKLLRKDLDVLKSWNTYPKWRGSEKG